MMLLTQTPALASTKGGSLRRALPHAASVCLLAMVGLLDVITGGELSFSIFYLVPVGLTTWYAGRLWGLATALLASLVWLGADVTWREYSHGAVPVWNAAVRLGFFALVAIGLARIKALLDSERQQARRDALTGVPNSRAFFELLDREAARARRNHRPLTIAYLDLDGFKQVNDRFGHLAGDRVLQEVARVLTGSLRINDAAARLGGDEFVLLLPETAVEDATIALDRIHKAVSQFTKEGAPAVTASIGAVTFLSLPTTTQEMVQQADALMYRVKRQGKCSVLIETFDEIGAAIRPARQRRGSN